MQTQENQYTILLWTKLIPDMYFSATMDRSIRVRKWIIRFLFTCSASSFYVLVCAHSLGDYFQHFHHHRHQSFNIINENDPPPHQYHRFDQFEFTIKNYKLQVVNENDPPSLQCHRFDQFELSCLAQDPDLCHQITWRSNLLDELPITITNYKSWITENYKIQTKNITSKCQL